jgi:DNA mismatch repair ATPase MutS
VTQESGRDSWTRFAPIESYAPRELLFPASLGALIKSGLSGKSSNGAVAVAGITAVQRRFPKSFQLMNMGSTATLTPDRRLAMAKRRLRHAPARSLQSKTLDGYGLTRKDEAIRAAGACLRYARDTQRAAAAHMSRISFTSSRRIISCSTA